MYKKKQKKKNLCYKPFSLKLTNQGTNNMETVRLCQEYFGMDLPSSIQLSKRTQKFEKKFYDNQYILL